MIPSLFIIVILLIGYLVYDFAVFKPKYEHKSKWGESGKELPVEWKTILLQKVSFYNSLEAEDKKHFEYKIQDFLANCRITGIDTSIDTTDVLLVASSAVIPIFGFNGWKYHNLYEVLVYPTTFNEKFETDGSDRQILGMVGTGYMEGKMILSKQALHLGFSNETDKKNTAIHEFVHLIDKADGAVDGIPKLLLEKQYAMPWFELINKKISEIYENTSDINPYGGTNQAEFFSVISEYFFERPQLLEKKHPELYILLERIFDQQMVSRNLNKEKLMIGRNSPCPCNSGVKFKKCCGKLHYS
jgi:Mlc titration factor MtfA (ptsG expression regulator)